MKRPMKRAKRGANAMTGRKLQAQFLNYLKPGNISMIGIAIFPTD